MPVPSKRETFFGRIAWWIYSITPRECNAFLLGALIVFLFAMIPALWECFKLWRIL